MFLAGKFLYLSVQTFLLQYVSFLATKRTKKRVEENANVSFFRHIQPSLHWFVARYVLLLTEIVSGLWSVTLEWIEFGCVHKLSRQNRIAYSTIAAVRRPILVTETKPV